MRLWLQFIPIFGALHPQLLKRHTTKKDIPMFHAKKDISMSMRLTKGNYVALSNGEE